MVIKQTSQNSTGPVVSNIINLALMEGNTQPPPQAQEPPIAPQAQEQQQQQQPPSSVQPATHFISSQPMAFANTLLKVQ